MFGCVSGASAKATLYRFMFNYSARNLILTAALVAISVTGCTREARKASALASAENDFKGGAYDNAKISYIKVLQLDQRSATPFARLGQIWLEEGAPLRAIAFLKKAEELAPKDSDNRLRLAQVYQAIGAQADARKEALKALEQSSTNEKALVFLTEIAHSPEEIGAAEEAIQKFPGKETALWHLAAANIALRKKDLAGAEEAIKKALAIDPKSPEAHQAQGIVNLVQKNPKGAVVELKTAATLAPARSNVQMTYAQFLSQIEGPDAATAYLKGLTAKAPDFLPAWIMLGRLAFAKGKYDEVSGNLENVFSRDPENIDARFLQSDVFLAKHEPEKAVTELEKLEKTYPELPPARYRMAQAYLQQNKTAQAGSELDQALAKNPDYTEAILARAELNLRTGKAAPAVSELQELLIKQPRLRPAQLLLADAYRAVGRTEDAASIFREQIKVTPDALEPYLVLGTIDVQRGKTDEARISFAKALELAPDNLLAIEQLVNLDLKAKDFAAATELVKGQLQKHPDRAAPWLLQGKLLMAQAQWKEAEKVLKKALELDPNSGTAYDMLVATYLTTNRLPDAAHELETVLAKAPQNQAALMTLAIIREKEKDYPKARDAYEKLLVLNPKFVPALNNLSYLYAEQFNQPDKAFELAQKARTLDSANPAVADTLGWAAYKRGDYQQALTLSQESATKVGDNPEIEFHLGMANYMMGQADAARAAFQKALAAPGNFPSKSKAQSRLALLGDVAGSSAALTVAQLEEMLKQQPNDPVARLRLAETYEKQNDWAHAAEAYEAALKINPKLPSAALKLAQIYSGPASNKEKALTYAKMARSLAPGDPKTTAILGRVAFDTGEFSWAYDLLREQARQADSDPRGLHDLAWAAYSLGKVAEARGAMQRSVNASPDAATASDGNEFLTLTALEINSAGLGSAKPGIDAQLKADPKYVPALMAAAALDLQSGSKTTAIDRYQQVLQRFPDFAPAQKQLAIFYADDPTHNAEAFDLATKARKSLPDDPALTRLLGQLSYTKKDYPRAIQFLQEVAEKKALDATGQYYLGMACKEEKRSSDAIKALTEALAGGNLPPPLVAEAQRALVELKKR